MKPTTPPQRQTSTPARAGDGARLGVVRIAADLSLGISTVAHALAGDGTISEKTRQRVLSHAIEVGYVPDRNARRMRAKRTGIIGLLVPDVVLNYNEIVQHVFRHVKVRGDEVQIALTEFNGELEDRAVTAMLACRADGILMRSHYARWSDVPERHALRRSVAGGVPLVLWANPIEGSGLPVCRGPFAAQGRQVAEHLIALGCRRLALCLPVPDALAIPSHAAHADGVRGAMADAGMDASRLRVVCPHTLDGPTDADGRPRFGNYIDQSVPRTGIDIGRRLTTQLFDDAGTRGDGPDGIIFQNDLMALGGLRALAGRGLAVPGDVRVGVLHHTIIGETSPLTLTHSRIDPAASTAAALDLLYRLIDARMDKTSPAASSDGEPTCFTEVVPHLVVGESSVARANQSG
jgi:DNA-binding LacI/PurR family transcriptional regulator